jgi:ComF family protein
MLKILPDSLLSLIYPQQCSVCKDQVESADDGPVCSRCWTSTRIFEGNETLCYKCGAFLLSACSRSTVQCRACGDQHYDRAVAVGIYEQGLSASLLRLKRVPHIPKRLKRLLVVSVERLPMDDSWVVIPVPLSPRRLQERGFNQAAVIGSIVSKAAGVALDESSVRRKVHTKMHRVGMDKKARAMTVKNAFEVTRPRLIENRNILLVDDILTSGETASTCAKILKKSGAATVNVFTVARAG